MKRRGNEGKEELPGEGRGGRGLDGSQEVEEPLPPREVERDRSSISISGSIIVDDVDVVMALLDRRGMDDERGEVGDWMGVAPRGRGRSKSIWKRGLPAGLTKKDSVGETFFCAIDGRES